MQDVQLLNLLKIQSYCLLNDSFIILELSHLIIIPSPTQIQNETNYKTYTTRLSCFNNLLVNSVKISKNARCGGGLVGSSRRSVFLTANKIPARCKDAIASRFLTASKPNDNANRFASS